ncbi:hypothetical protein HDU87_003848 [Geranomyces variabilis]|uniref:Enoyl reductase (ER) domain-containing protein n=1 Tax=Geranomyces variabilis TaxID=109894 RepID=A0AAD5XR03_9FUNG|nr:hypothetical protein HDU87_003848 [Geranomyces variabilis]
MPKAFVVKEINKFAVEDVGEPPAPADGHVIIKVKAAAVNPVDYKMARTGYFVKSFPARLGIDVSGTVSAVGPNVTQFKLGDEVFGRPAIDGFSEYATAPASGIYRKPANLTHEQASTLGCGVSTAIIGLFADSGLKLARPKEHRKWFAPEWVLVWGASSSVGAYAVQLAAAAGYSVIATASAKHHDAVRKLGAVHVVDYSRPDAIEELKKLAGGGRCRTAFDAVGGSATRMCADALRADTDRPSTVVSIAADVNNPPQMPEGVQLLPRVNGFDPASHSFASQVMNEEVLEYFAAGRLAPNKVKVVDGGLDGVAHALELSSSGKVSGEKLVVVLA